MTTFFLDLWQDLRAKRLWPIAVALLVGTIAVPVLLFKPASDTPPALGTAQPEGQKLPAVALDQSSVANSHLNVFKQKDPFNSLSDATPATTTGGNQTTLGKSVDSAVSSANKSSSSASGGSGGGGSAPGPSSGLSSGSAPAGPDGKPMTPGVHFFKYTVDLRFGRRGSEKRYASVNPLDILPDQNVPIISFYGVNNGKVAVFFIVDPAFRADGEGKCVPSDDNCRFLYLRTDDAHNEATLSSQNGTVEYSLELRAIHVKSIDEKKVVGTSTPDKGTPKSKLVRKAGHGKASKRALRTLATLPAMGLLKR